MVDSATTTIARCDDQGSFADTRDTELMCGVATAVERSFIGFVDEDVMYVSCPGFEPPCCPSRRRLLHAALAVAGIAAGTGLTGCNGRVMLEPAAKDSAPEEKAFGVVGPLTLDPVAATDPGSRAVVQQLFEPLFRYNVVTGVLESVAAESFEFSDDARTLRIALRDMAFHDGESVTSRDYLRAWERLLRPKGTVAERYGQRRPAHLLSLVKGYREFVAGDADGLSGVSCPDEHTLQVELTVPYAFFPYVLAHPSLAAVPATADDDEEDFERNPCGNGPYKLARARQQRISDVELACTDEAQKQDGTPALRIEVFEDESDMYSEYLTDELDGSPLPHAEVRDLDYEATLAAGGQQIGEGKRLAVGAEPVVHYLACNMAAPFTARVEVRRALSLAIDREHVCNAIFHRAYLPAYSIVSPAIEAADQFTWPYADTDLAQAREMLKAVEDDDTEQTLVFLAGAGLDKLADELVSQLGRLGFTFVAKGMKEEEFSSALEQGDFALALLSWTADAPVADCVLYPLLHSASVGSNNHAGYRNDEVDAKINAARAELDATRRVQLLVEANAAAAQDCPVIPLCFATYAYAVHDDIERLRVLSDGTPLFETVEYAE